MSDDEFKDDLFTTLIVLEWFKCEVEDRAERITLEHAFQIIGKYYKECGSEDSDVSE